MLTQREQRKAAKEFAERWKGIGYEKVIQVDFGCHY